jgi:MFS family permease
MPGHTDEVISYPGDAGPDVGARAPEAERPVQSASQVPTADVHRAYLDGVAIGYVIYLVGAVTAFLAVALSLSDAQAGLHSSALAIGFVLAGLFTDRLDRLVGVKAAHVGALGLLIVAGVLIAWAPAFGATLLGAAAVGLGTGVMLAHNNRMLTTGGGALGRVRLSRSVLIAMVSSLTMPVFIGVGVATGLGWQFVVVPAIVVVAISLVAARGRVDGAADVVAGGGRLPRAYWTPWFLVVLVVAVEFAILFWGSTLVERRAGVSLGDATLTISAYVGGMVVARFGLSFHAVSERDPVTLVRGSLLFAVVGVVILWATTSYEMSMLGMFVAGLGLGMLYPLGATIAIAAAPGQAAVASGRVILASGLAILIAPLVLGVVADATGVATAWLLIPVVCVAALALTVPVARGRAQRAGAI